VDCAHQIAIDKARATELTRPVLFGTKNGASNWYNCSPKLGLPSQIEFGQKLNSL
jgi:hypothetical protein